MALIDVKDIRRLRKKTIFIKTNSNRVYNGQIIEIHELPNGQMLLGILDKFGKTVLLSMNEIDVLEEK